MPRNIGPPFAFSPLVRPDLYSPDSPVRRSTSSSSSSVNPFYFAPSELPEMAKRYLEKGRINKRAAWAKKQKIRQIRFKKLCQE